LDTTLVLQLLAVPKVALGQEIALPTRKSLVLAYVAPVARPHDAIERDGQLARVSLQPLSEVEVLLLVRSLSGGAQAPVFSRLAPRYRGQRAVHPGVAARALQCRRAVARTRHLGGGATRRRLNTHASRNLHTSA